MHKNHPPLLLLSAAALLLASTQWAMAQSSPATDGVPVSMVVTVQPHHGSDEPKISADDVVVNQNHARAKVVDWVPLQGDHAGLELFILLDDSRDSSRGSLLDDLRHFILAQPATTKIGVAYMRIGGPKIVQSLTADHTLAAGALHPSPGSLANGDSPYSSLSELIKQWPAGNDATASDRREVLMISNGVDGQFADFASDKHDPSVDSAIEKAQRAGVVVFAIRLPGEDRASSPTSQSRNFLSEVAYETGGESYDHQSGAPVSFAPYLDDSTHQLSRQYRLTFLAQPQKKPGMQSVKVRTEVPHAELVSAQKVYVPSGPQ